MPSHYSGASQPIVEASQFVWQQSMAGDDATPLAAFTNHGRVLNPSHDVIMPSAALWLTQGIVYATALVALDPAADAFSVVTLMKDNSTSRWGFSSTGGLSRSNIGVPLMHDQSVVLVLPSDKYVTGLYNEPAVTYKLWFSSSRLFLFMRVKEIHQSLNSSVTTAIFSNTTDKVTGVTQSLAQSTLVFLGNSDPLATQTLAQQAFAHEQDLLGS